MLRALVRRFASPSPVAFLLLPPVSCLLSRSTQLKYFIDQKRMTVEDRRFRWDHFLTGMHARGGFEQEGLLDRSWSVIVDLVCVAIVLWIASGLYMWWGLPGSGPGAGSRLPPAR